MVIFLFIKVCPDGSRIDMDNIGRKQSEQARKGIEKGLDWEPLKYQKARTISTKTGNCFVGIPNITPSAIFFLLLF